jgi:predicted nucleic acid-binding protein
VVDETLTLLRSRGYGRVAVELGTRFFSQQAVEIVMVDLDDLLRAWDVFRTHGDKAWSFTDCTSKVVMERLGISSAFAFDQHFRQFGTIQVVP